MRERRGERCYIQPASAASFGKLKSSEVGKFLMLKKNTLSQAKPKLEMNHAALPAPSLAAAQVNWVTGSLYVELPDVVIWGNTQVFPTTLLSCTLGVIKR